MNEEHFWDDPKAAQNVIRQCNGMKELEAKYHQMEQSLASLQETVDELNQNFDEELKELLDMEYQDTLNQFEDFEVMVLLSHPYDKNNAILELHPGAGGTESQDWASMLGGTEGLQGYAAGLSGGRRSGHQVRQYPDRRRHGLWLSEGGEGGASAGADFPV